MQPASLALQKALHQRLSSTLNNIAVYDGAPSDAVFPYVTIGEGRALIEGVDQINRHDHQCHVFVFSQHDGISETKEIVEEIHNVLAARSLSVEGHQLILLTITEMRWQSVSDGKTWRGQLTFRALTEPKQNKGEII